MISSSKRLLYEDFCHEQQISLPLFFQPYWLDAVCPNGEWDAVVIQDKNERVLAILPYIEVKKYGLKTIIGPPLSPYLGLWINYPPDCKNVIKYDWDNEIVEQVLSQLPNFSYFQQSFHTGFRNWSPFYWADFQQFTHYSYKFEDTSDLDSIWKGIQSNQRNKIKRADQILHIEYATDIEPLFSITQQTFKEEKVHIPNYKTILSKIVEALSPRHQMHLLYAKTKDNRVVGAMLLVHDNQSAYNLCLGIDRTYKEISVGPYILWKGIEKSSELKLNFDFEGTMIKRVDKLFRDFNAPKVENYIIWKANNKLIATARLWLKQRL